MYAHLHVHTEYSLLDGMSSIKDLPKYAKELGMEALAITDHGNMFGAVKFSKACHENGIKPIIGCEVYTAERTMQDKDSEKDRAIGHLVLLCKNETGYKNLIKIVSHAYTEGFYYKPRTDKNELRKYHEGLVCLSACLAGKTQRLLLQNKYAEAKAEALELYDIFGEDFYLEVQDHGQEEDKVSINGLMQIHKETGIPLVATNDAHYIRKEDVKAHEILLCMQTQSTISNKKFVFNAPEYYLKSAEEMRTLFSYIPEACDNTVVIADKCNFDFEYGHYHIPKYDIPEGFENAEAYFRHLCYEGFHKKYETITPQLEERLEYEISTIINMGFVEYFLIVWDFINYAKTHGIPTGVGRGSAAGSCVAYCLSITEVEPTKYNLFFERFLNPERVTMPDIDVDFCIKRRGEVIDYVTRKYGEDSVCQISTFGTMKAKMAVKDVARVLEVPYLDSNRLSKMIPDGLTLQEALDTDPDLKHDYDTSPQTKTVFDIAMQLENTPRHCSTHAAGVVIAPEPVDNFVPLVKSQKGIATEYTMTEIEELGLLKMDFLGLRNLTVIQDAIDQIKKNHGVDIDINDIPFDDEKVYQMLSKGKTVGVFQLESKGITDFIKKLKPSCIEDVIAAVALYRPGPMDSIPTFLKNKRHPDKIEYITPELASILDVTYGVIIYQEQVMQIVQNLAGYSFARADLVRRAMSKKKAAVMAEERNYFINGKLDADGNIEIPGCIRNGISKEAAEEIFDEMESFAQYAFNKSHATAYSFITYQTAWLKYHYPSEFMAALMTSEEDDHDHLAIFIKEARKLNVDNGERKIKVLPPSINKSSADFTATKEGDILYGLAAIKSVGRNIAEDIAGNFYSNLYDVAAIPKLNVKAFNNLAYSGALNEISPNIATAIINSENLLKNCRKSAKRVNQISLFDFGLDSEEILPDLPISEEYPKDQLLALEKLTMGVYLTGHPMKKYKTLIKENTNLTAKDVADTNVNGVIAGMITAVKTHYTKKGDKMAFITVEDLDDDSFDVVVFPKIYQNSRELIEEGTIIAMYGKTEEGDSFLPETIVNIESLQTLSGKYVRKKNKSEYNILKIIGTDALYEKIWAILERYNGEIPVRLYSDKKKSILLNQTVNYDGLLLLELEELVGKENVKFDKLVS